MKLRIEQLEQHLKQPLASIYIVCGDEPLQVQETSDTIRQQAVKQGFIERQRFVVETGFDWQQLLASANALSLFSEQQLLELHIPSGNPGDAGRKALVTYTENPPQDKLLLIIAGKIESSTQKTKWFKTLEKASVLVQAWPINAAQLPRWIAQRMRQAGLQADLASTQLISERTEGNLLACAQEIEKLRLLYGEGKLSHEQVAAAVANSARYDVFNLADTALQGDQAGVMRIIQGLEGEGTAAPVVLWALAREIRALAKMAFVAHQEQSIDAAMRSQYIWEKRRPLIKRALQTHSLKRLQSMLQQATKIDSIIKGNQAGNAWDELQRLALALARTKRPRPQAAA